MKIGIRVKRLHPDLCYEMDCLKENLKSKMESFGIPDPIITDEQVSKVVYDKLAAVKSLTDAKVNKRKKELCVITKLRL